MKTLRLPMPVASATVNLVNPNETVEAEKAIMNVQSPNKWSAEFPHLYTPRCRTERQER